MQRLIGGELITEILSTKIERPRRLHAEVYKVRTPKSNSAIYITISYTMGNEKTKKPFEMFVNSKDLGRAAEYAAITRLISAIFRNSSNPQFVIDELKSIYDPSGGYYNNGVFMNSIYGEIAMALEEFLGIKQSEEVRIEIPKPEETESENKLMFCPECQQKTAKYENGCITCTDEKCGYSKCDH